jgi:hypothetical protein
MKKLLIVFFTLFAFIGCAKSDKYTSWECKYKQLLREDSITKSEYNFLVRGLYELKNVDSLKTDSVQMLKDSINQLNSKPLMTKEQFIKLYKYESLYKYYRIVINKPSQKKYYWGWSKRVFEQ